MAKFRPKKAGIVFTTLFTLAVFTAVFLTISSYGYFGDQTPTWNEVLDQAEAGSNAFTVSAENYVGFIDCGQGDCEVLVSNGSVAIIDTGTNANEQSTLQRLKNLGITTVDALILTHPHEDHIGGADKIFNAFEVKSVYMMKPSADNTPTTKVYEQTLEAILNEGLTITQPKINSTLKIGDFNLKFLSPSKDYDDHNNNSIVIRADIKGKSFLFTGDAESEPEKDMLKNCKSDLNVDVLKVGHHGSKNSTTKEFLNAVSPKIAVVSCGEGNDYGHPHGATLKRLKDIEIYRTDFDSTVIVSIENSKLNVITQGEKK